MLNINCTFFANDSESTMDASKRAVQCTIALAVTLLAGCGSYVPLVGDVSSDIETPSKGMQLRPAVGYVPSCEYAQPSGPLAFQGAQDRAAVSKTCLGSFADLANIPGLTVKQVTFPGGQDERSLARSGGTWIDRDLETSTGAKYRIVFARPFVADGDTGKFLQSCFAIQRIADSKLIKTKPCVYGQKDARSAAVAMTAMITRLLADASSDPPDFFMRY